MNLMKRGLLVLGAWTGVAVLFAIQMRFQGDTPPPALVELDRWLAARGVVELGRLHATRDRGR
jgi:hypothetical protein